MNEVTVSQELIPVKSINVPELFTTKAMVEALLSKIEKRAKEHVADISTATSRKEIASNAYKVSQSKTFLDGLGKDFVAVRKAELKVSDELRKLIRDNLDALRDEVRKPLTEWEAAEEARIAKEKAEAEYMAAWDEALAEDSLFNRQRDIERREAELARIDAEKKAKEESERLERERKEREDRIAKDAAERAKREAEEAAKKQREQAEREKKAAEGRAAQAERDRIAAVERAKLEAEAAERRRIESEKKAEADRIQAVKDAEARANAEFERKKIAQAAKEAADKAEAERLARNKAHQKAFNNDALKCLTKEGVDKETAIKIITLIAQGKITHIRIEY